MLIQLFLSGFILSLSLCLDLGMVNVAIVREGMLRGFWPSFLIGLGSSFGDLTYAVLATTGVTLLLGIVEVRYALWIGGTAALLYFAAAMVRSAWKPAAMNGGPGHSKVGPTAAGADAGLAGSDRGAAYSGGRAFLWGWGLAIASPTSILWFATVGGSVVAKSPVQGAHALAAFLGGFFCASVVWSLGMAALSAYSGSKLGPAFVRAISVLSALLFLYLAAEVFLDGYRTLAVAR